MSHREAASKWETSGFYGSPITKTLCLGIVLAHITMANTTIPDNLISLPISPWKLLFSTIAFANLGELVWSLPILYAFRGLERRMGSRKFVSFCILCSVCSSLTNIGLLHIFSFTKIASGPYPIIFGLFIFYFAMIPKLSPNSLSLFGIQFSDKTMTYFMGLQLALNTWSNSLASATTGVLFGLMYTAEILPFHRFRVPSSVSSLMNRMMLPWLGSKSPWETRVKREQQRQQARNNQINNMTPQQMAELAQRDPAAAQQLLQQAQQMATQHQQRMQQRGGNNGGGNVGNVGGGGGGGGVPVVEPTEENIAQIVAMGFTAERAREALLSTQNNVEAAVGRLFD